MRIQIMAANIIVGTVLAVLIFLAVRKVVKDRKKGIGSCGMNCSSCPYHDHGGCDSGKTEKRRVRS